LPMTAMFVVLKNLLLWNRLAKWIETW
jgi:hypothetical protein